MEKLATYVVREGALSSRDAVGWIYRLTVTLTPIHGLGVAHGRVSAKGILIESPDCRSDAYLLDAGDLVDDPSHYSLPRCQGGPRCPADDTWAAGVILYRMLTGQLPFPGVSAAAVADRINRAPPAPLAVFDVGDDELQLILDRLFARDVFARLTDLAELGRLLLEWDPSLRDLLTLRFGKPGADDDFDDDEGELTQVYQVDEPAAAKPYRLVQGSRAPWDPPAPAPATSAARESVDVVLDDQAGDDVLVDERAGLDIIDEPQAPANAAAPQPDRSGPSIAVVLDAEDTADEPSARAIPSPPSSPLPTTAAPSQAPAPARRKRSAQRTVLWLLAAAAVLAAAAWIRFGGSPSAPRNGGSVSAEQPAAPPPTTAEAGPTSRSTSAASSAPPASQASASASAAPTSPAAPTTPEQMRACMLPLFPSGTFAGKEPSFDFVCQDTNPHKASIKLRTEVVRAARGVNEGMREWANLGWYGMAVFGIARARCCANLPPLHTPTTLPQCELDTRIEALGKAVAGGQAGPIEEAYDGFNKAISCLTNGGAAPAFGEEGLPRGGARTVFERSLGRARQLTEDGG